MSRPEPPFPFRFWDQLGDHVDRILDGVFPSGAPVPHDDDCADHDRCITVLVVEDYLGGDEDVCRLVHPLVVYWHARHQAETN